MHKIRKSFDGAYVGVVLPGRIPPKPPIPGEFRVLNEGVATLRAMLKEKLSDEQNLFLEMGLVAALADLDLYNTLLGLPDLS